MDIKEVKEFFLQAKRKNKIANSYIIHAGTEEQRREIASFVAVLMNCKQQSPCYTCPACKNIASNVFPDVKWIQPSKSILSINDVRGIKEDIYITPYSGEKKIYFFEINYMREESANSLLKILEEPPAYGLLVILSNNIHTLLPTITSRCQKLRLNYALPLHDKESEQAQQEFADILQKVKKRSFFEFFKQVDSLVKAREREEIEHWLEKAILFYRDIYFKEYLLPDDLMINRDIGAGIWKENAAIIETIGKILEIKTRVRYNINLKLGLENLFLQVSRL